MDVGPPELLKGHLLLGDALDHLGPGDEHVARAPAHEDEVGHGGAVDGAPGARPQDGGDLGDDPGVDGVPVEDLPVAREAVHPFLDPGPGGVVQADDGGPHLGREVHEARDLAAVHLAQGAAQDREVLAEDEDEPPPMVP